MKRLGYAFLVAGAISLPTLVLAQDQNPNQSQPGDHRDHRGEQPGGQRPGAGGQPVAQPGTPLEHRDDQRGPNGANHGGDNHGGDNRGGDNHMGGDQRQGWQGDRGRGDEHDRRDDHADHGGYSHNRPPPGNYWRPDGGRPVASYWQGRRWNDRPVYGARYEFPRGYHYRHWSPGGLLPLPFLQSSYFFDDFADLGLPAPGSGYRWVRYGPDLLLVSVRNGRIRDVRYGVFG